MHALQKVDLDVAPGTMVAVLGPSGSGKTTLLNVIGGIESADCGTVMVAGQDISSCRPRDLGAFRRTHVGFVFQFFNLIPTLTAYENVQAVIELTGRETAAACWIYLPLLACRIAPLTSPRNSRAANSNGSPSPERWPPTRTWCSRTNRPVRSTSRRADRFCSCCNRPAAPGAGHDGDSQRGSRPDRRSGNAVA
ncbi:ABC transporter family protein [Mycobacterium xenopi 4042]|uniref:ABC transporter family protein n=1 Tax=Mycobacterium xenopi 4042 TaxID=1299334 RepID=X8AGK9_MYCXE|nr:ABC transporter family protein [Mycobacterium xenopi 4042]